LQRDGVFWKFVQDLAIDSQQPNSVRIRQCDELTVISRAIRSRNELKNRRGRNGELLSIGMVSARFAMALASSTPNARCRIDPASAFRNSERHRIGTIQSWSFARAAAAPAENREAM
jgi:hypothetical protein